MARRMLRHMVPVDDQPMKLSLNAAARVRSVAAREVDVVEFWAEHRDDEPAMDRVFQVFGTGQPLPDNAVWRRTCPRTAQGLVWHLYELMTP